MKKILLILCTALFITGCAVSDTGSSDMDILTLFSSNSNAANKAWVGTFQLVFNDMKDKVLKLDKIEFVGEQPTKELIGLNKEEFNSSMLDPETYYTSYGPTSPKARDTIKKDIKEKFDETSDLIDALDWKEVKGRYYAYAMLKKEFEFLREFDKLDPRSFNNSAEKYDFFGIKNHSELLAKNIRVLFYDSPDDFALQLLTKGNDTVYLYRTESEDSFDKIYKKMLKSTDNYKDSKHLLDDDTFLAPNLKFKSKRNYAELCNKIIKNTDGYYFSMALETLQFELNNKGGKIKSEAVIMADATAIAFEDEPKPRHFDFDKTFVMFLVDKGKTDPYFALRVKDLKNLNK